MDTTTYDPRQAIQQNLEGKLSGTQLLRGFMTYGSWKVPAAEVAGEQPRFESLRDDSGRFVCCAFSDWRAVSDYLAAQGGQASASETAGIIGYSDAAGWAVFGNLPADVDVVSVNPFSLPGPGIHYEKEQVPQLLYWARVVGVEGALTRLVARLDAGDLSLVKHFDEFRIVLQQGAGGLQLVLTHDEQGRGLAPVFTAEDSLWAYLDQVLPRMNDQPLVLKRTGEELFATLQQMQPQGYVFNCNGPVAPSVFPPELAGAVLAAE